MENFDKYIPGMGCQCFAHNVSECCCDADWTTRTEKRVVMWRDMSDSEMRLRCGEMTAQEIRTVRAVMNQILPKR